MSSGLAGGVAVITGAAGGLGEGFARAAAARGMKLVLADVDERGLTTLVESFAKAGTEATGVVTDVADAAACEKLAAITFEKYRAVRLLINNAGIEALGEIWTLPLKRWEQIVRINLLGPVHGLRAFLPRMIEAGEPGYVANVASVGGLGMMPLNAAYIASKHAVLSLTECLKLELDEIAPQISVSVVMPGAVATRIFEGVAAAGAAAEGQHAVMKKLLAEHGLTPAAAAEIILPQIEARQFWTTSHPELLAETANNRAAYLSGLVTPNLDRRARDLSFDAG